MLAPTHSVFGIFLTLVILAFFGVQWGLHWTIILVAIIGSIFPDIDHPRSVIGRIFYPISSRLERAFGHRTITHSLIGWAIASAVFAVLVIFSILILGLIWDLGFGVWDLPVRWIAAFSISYLSHLILDMFTRRGSQMLWPDPGRDVIPRDPRYRPKSGSKFELIIFIVMVLLMFLAFPISKYGVISSFRWLIATPSSAIEEFKSMKTRAYIDFKGYFESTKQNVSGTAEILDTDHKKLIVLYSPPVKGEIQRGFVYTLNEEHTADITASKAKIKKTAIPVNIERVEFRDISHGELLKMIPDNALVSGTVDLPEGIDIAVPVPAGSYKTIDKKGGSLVLNYACKADLEKIVVTEKYDIQRRKNTAELAGLRAKARALNSQIADIRSGGDLTELGRQVMTDKTGAEKRAAKLEDLQSQLAETSVKIDELNLKMKARALIFSGNIYIRR